MNQGVIQQMIDQALLQLHTGFCAKVININGNLADVQPLNMIKEIGGKPQRQALAMNCPVLESVVAFTSLDPIVIRRVQAGDTVYCICADRDISETRSGEFALPPIGHHALSNAVVVGIL